MTAPREKISVCVMTFNEERKLRRCLESVRWCDEIVVLDSFSTDRTVEIARTYTDRVYQQAWLGYVGQRNLVRELATHPWLLFLDADEEVSKGLREEIDAVFSRGPAPHVGFEFPRRVYYLGRWIRYGEWYPDVKLRLFHRDHGRSEGLEPHDRVVVNGPVLRLRNPVWHYTYDGLDDQLRTMNRFSTISAQQKFMAGERFHWRDFLFRPPLRFLKGYVLRGGFLDGTRGLVIATISAFGAAMKYVKLWELHLRRGQTFRELPGAYPPSRPPRRPSSSRRRPARHE